MIFMRSNLIKLTFIDLHQDLFISWDKFHGESMITLLIFSQFAEANIEITVHRELIDRKKDDPLLTLICLLYDPARVACLLV